MTNETATSPSRIAHGQSMALERAEPVFERNLLPEGLKETIEQQRAVARDKHELAPALGR